MRRNLIRVSGLAALACAAAGLAAAQASAQAPLPQSVTDSHKRFSMSFPADWQIVTKPEGMIALLAAGPAQAGYRPTINVVVEPLSQTMSPEAYATAANRLAKVTFHNYTVVQEAGVTVAGQPAYYRYFTWETNTGVTLYQLQVYFTNGPTGFVVTGSTRNDSARLREDTTLFTQIIGTFRLGGPG